MKQQILGVLEKSLTASAQKHALNARIMLENPMAIHEHTDFMAAIELELEKIAEYQDKLEALKWVAQK